MTINEALALQVAVKKRLSELQTLRNQVSIKRSSIYGVGDNSRSELEEPQYDVKTVDKKVVELETFLFKVDSQIKQANAKYTIDLVADVDKLLEPLQ